MTSQQNRKGSQKPAIRFYHWIYLLVLFLVALFFLRRPEADTERETNWNEIENVWVPQKAIEKVEVINGEKALFFIRNEKIGQPPFRDSTSSTGNLRYSLQIGSIEMFEKRLEEVQKNVPPAERIYPVYRKTNSWLQDVIGSLLPLIVLFLFWGYLLRRAGSAGEGPFFSFGKSKATAVDRNTKINVTFNDVAGLDEAEMEVKEIVEFLKNPERFTKLGATIPKGVILVGPPGTGKTLLAKAVAGEADVPFFSMSGSEFVEMFVGVGASRVRDLFRLAKENTPSIVFIDEIDAIGRSRGKNAFYTGSNDERESTLNQLLKEMDGFESNSGVIVLAATNRADMLDPALLRPGRFDRHIYLELPNKKERDEIFQVHLRPLRLEENFDAGFLSAQTPGFSGAEIANVCNEAALIAARKNRQQVGREAFLEAIDRIVAGMEHKTKIISSAEKKIIAYHEAGHAFISWQMKHVDPLVKVSIIPRGKSLGAAWYLPEEKQLRTKTEFREHLCATLGGRAAEEIVFGEPTSGALDDLEKATKEAYMMVAYFGFNENMGVVSFYDSTGQRDTGFVKPYSEETARLIDEDVCRLLNDAYEHTKELLQQNRETLDRLATLLLQKETLYKEDLEAMLGKRMLSNEPAGV